jgi:hypothetical protein
MRDFRLRYAVDAVFAFLGFYAALAGSFFTDVSEQSIGPIFKGQGLGLHEF